MGRTFLMQTARRIFTSIGFELYLMLGLVKFLLMGSIYFTISKWRRFKLPNLDVLHLPHLTSNFHGILKCSLGKYTERKSNAILWHSLCYSLFFINILKKLFFKRHLQQTCQKTGHLTSLYLTLKSLCKVLYERIYMHLNIFLNFLVQTLQTDAFLLLSK